jgi:hypothetical protein
MQFLSPRLGELGTTAVVDWVGELVAEGASAWMGELLEAKASWGDGPWQREPDRAEWWIDGLPCIALRHDKWGTWCGYVGVPRGHAFWGLFYGDLRSVRLGWWGPRVHGGLTWSSDSSALDLPPGYWWFGFDCGHGEDLVPGRAAMLARVVPSYLQRRTWETYRDLAYVQEECLGLARQLAKETVRPHIRRLDGRGGDVYRMARVTDRFVPKTMTRRRRRRVQIAVNAAVRVVRDAPRAFCRRFCMDGGPAGAYVRQWAAEYRWSVLSTRLRLDLEAERAAMEAAGHGAW